MKKLLLTCFGLGRLPVAPGTFGSLPPAVLFMVIAGFEPDASITFSVMLMTVLISSALCVALSPALIKATGQKDPKQIVMDEVAGQSVTFLFVSNISADKVCLITAIGFILFRIFDVIKLWPICRLEKLPKGWGILADDLLAGVFAGIGLLIVLRWWP